MLLIGFKKVKKREKTRCSIAIRHSTFSLVTSVRVVCGKVETGGGDGGGGGGGGGGGEGGCVGVTILVVSAPNWQYKTLINPILALVAGS